MRERRMPWSALRGIVGTIAIALGIALGVTQAVSVAAAVGEPPAGAAFEVTDDDAGSALFSVAPLGPGHTASNCISVAHRLEGGSGLQLRLFAEASGALAQDLGLSIETGTGARFGNCSSFKGSPIYIGRLGEFATIHGDATTGAATVVDAPEGLTAYRFTVWPLDTAAPSSTAEATFTWAADLLPGAATTTAPRPMTATLADAPAAAPTASAGAGTRTSPAGIAAEDASAAVTPETAPADLTPVAPSATSSGSRRSTPPSAAASLEPIQDEPRFGELVGAVATVVVTKGSFPILLIAIGVAFLLVQDFIDRRDPKLALAPVHAEPDVVFAEA